MIRPQVTATLAALVFTHMAASTTAAILSRLRWWR